MSWKIAAKHRARALDQLKRYPCSPEMPYRDAQGRALHQNVQEVRKSEPVVLRCLDCGAEFR